MAAIPAYVRTWTQNLTTGTPGTRIPFVSLIDTMQNYVYGVKTFLVAGGHSVVWSASGGVGPANAADHTDRLINAAAFTPRATVANASQGWVVTLDGNGGHLLIAYTGASDDIAYISYSPSASFVLAGTTNQRPTAVDELVIASTITLVGATASADRVWHGLISADAKAYRFTILRSTAIVGETWFVENFTPATFGGNVVLAHPVYAAAVTPGNMLNSNFCENFSPNNQGGQASIVVSGVTFATGFNFSTWRTGGGGTMFNDLNFQMELQSASYLPYPAVLYARNTAGARGALGSPIDMWLAAPSSFAVGDGFGLSYEWWNCGVWLWPNPSNVAPTIA